jgi:hypothetical protein
MEKGDQKMKFVKMSKEEIEKLVSEGKLKQVHLSTLERILMPRGSLQKESIGMKILESLLNNHQHWTNPKYSDNPDVGALLFHLKKNLDSEVSRAWNEFLRMVNSGKSEEEMWKDFWDRRDEERKR